jgi:hypothetical protein
LLQHDVPGKQKARRSNGRRHAYFPRPDEQISRLEQKGSQRIAIRILWTLETSPRTPVYKPKDSTTSSSQGAEMNSISDNFIRTLFIISAVLPGVQLLSKMANN